MKYSDEYIIPENIGDISRSLRGRAAYYLAGGTDIMSLKKEGVLEDRVWVDISAMEELKGIRKEGGSLCIGPLTTMSEIEKSPLTDEYATALKEAAGDMGSPLIRNLATVGGNIANSSPAADTLPALCALDAVIRIEKAGSSKDIPVDEFVTCPGKNILEPDEIITSVTVPVYPGSKSGFLKLGSRKALAISKVSVAAWWVEEERIIKDISVFMGAVGPRPLRARRTENILKEDILNQEKINEAKETIQTESRAIDDFRSTAEYCSRMTGVLLERILKAKYNK